MPAGVASALTRNPKAAASGDSPSTIRMTPCSTRAAHSAYGRSVPCGATITLAPSPAPAVKPIDESSSLQPPGLSPMTWKEKRAAAWTGIHKTQMIHSHLARKGIPDSDPYVVKGRPARIAGVHQVGPPEQIHGEHQRRGSAAQAKSQAGSGLHVVRPIEALKVGGEIPVPIQLRVQTREASLGLAQRVPGAILRIEQRIVLKAAHVNRVVVGLREEAVRTFRQQVAKAFGVGNAAAIIGRHETGIGGRGAIAQLFTGFKPSGDAVPAAGGEAERADHRILGKILRR